MGFKLVIVPEGSMEGLDKFRHALIPCRTLLTALQSAMDISSSEIVIGKKKASSRTRRKPSKYASIIDDDSGTAEFDEMLSSDYDP